MKFVGGDKCDSDQNRDYSMTLKLECDSEAKKEDDL